MTIPKSSSRIWGGCEKIFTSPDSALGSSEAPCIVAWLLVLGRGSREGHSTGLRTQAAVPATRRLLYSLSDGFQAQVLRGSWDQVSVAPTPQFQGFSISKSVPATSGYPGGPGLSLACKHVPCPCGQLSFQPGVLSCSRLTVYPLIPSVPSCPTAVVLGWHGWPVSHGPRPHVLSPSASPASSHLQSRRAQQP